MPIFEFICVPCDKRFEKLVKSQTDEAPACPVCGSTDVKKQISTFSSAGAAASASQCTPGG